MQNERRLPRAKRLGKHAIPRIAGSHSKQFDQEESVGSLLELVSEAPGHSRDIALGLEKLAGQVGDLAARHWHYAVRCASAENQAETRH